MVQVAVGAVAYIVALHVIAPALVRDAEAFTRSLLRPGQDDGAAARTNVASG